MFLSLTDASPPLAEGQARSGSIEIYDFVILLAWVVLAKRRGIYNL